MFMTQTIDYGTDTLPLMKEILERSEYEIFSEAYSAWHGHPPSERQLVNLFGKYLNSGEVPFFVRHYCREFITNAPDQLSAWQAQQRHAKRVNMMVYLVLAVWVTGALVL